MKYYVVPDDVTGSPTVVGSSGKAPDNAICMATRVLHENADCMALVEDDSDPRFSMKSQVDQTKLDAKLNRLQSQGIIAGDGWNEATILQRIKAGIFGG